MSETKFTPGPWFAVGARVLARSKNQLDEDEALSIADVDMDVRIDVDGEGAVNAALIAAAPEMYEALADASFYLKSLGVRLAALDLDTIETYGTLKTAAMFASVLDAALAKARGVSPTPPEGGRDMSAAHEDDMDYLDTEKCWHCGGEGGYASCQEDCCPYEGGEEACDDPVCWRRCSTCKGKGWLSAAPLPQPPEET